jgi:hypothetical protein
MKKGMISSNPGMAMILRLDRRSNVSKQEKAMLGSIDRRRDDSEDASLRTGLLDSTDEDGTPLNEKSFGNERNDDLSADDLDVPEENDEMPGEEDEENEDYSLSDNNDDDDREINPDLMRFPVDVFCRCGCLIRGWRLPVGDPSAVSEVSRVNGRLSG